MSYQNQTIPDYSEADTRAKLIDPALYARGWKEHNISREVNAGGIYQVRGRWKRDQKFADYLLRVQVAGHAEPVAIALIEAKKNTLPPHHGLEQAKLYADAERLNVPFVFTANGYRFVEYDHITGNTSPPKLMSEFPTPAELRQRYERHKGFNLDDEAAKPLLTPYTGGDSVRRYYQDAAIRAVLEKIAAGEKRMLLSLTMGSGKTRIAAYLLKRIADAGQLGRVLFVCDRTELREQAISTFQNIFGNDAQEVSAKNPQKNARILIATYQTLDVETGDTDQHDEHYANFFLQHYPENYFSHIIIDECHRSAWGKWSIILKRNTEAVHIGLTATPRQIEVKTTTPATALDAQITADNIEYFGEPVYEYSMAQGISDGYLAACEIQLGRVNLDRTGISIEEVIARHPINPLTGQPASPETIRELYDKPSFERQIILPDRQLAMSEDLFRYLLETGGPEQKTVIFCATDNHADQIAALLNNLYQRWCRQQNRPPKPHYAFKCTANSSGNDLLPDFRSSANSYFVATTVDLLSTGVDVPRIANIVFFRYVQSPIAFYQMVGRGTRLYPPDDKLVFRVYDYTNATQLFGQAFLSKALGGPTRDGNAGTDAPPPIRDPGGIPYVTHDVIEVVGFEVHVTNAGRYIVTQIDGKETPITVEEYKQRIAAQLVAQAPDLPTFRQQWVEKEQRETLIQNLPVQGQSALFIQKLETMLDYDLYDVLAEVGYGMNPRTREERVDAFSYKHATWLNTMPTSAAATIRALVHQFAIGGTEELDNRFIWRVPEVSLSGGVQAVSVLGKPIDVLRETKARMFAA